MPHDLIDWTNGEVDPLGASWAELGPVGTFNVLEQMIERLQTLRDDVGADRWEFPFIGTNISAGLLHSICDGSMDDDVRFISQPVYRGRVGGRKVYWRFKGRYTGEDPHTYEARFLRNALGDTDGINFYVDGAFSQTYSDIWTFRASIQTLLGVEFTFQIPDTGDVTEMEDYLGELAGDGLGDWFTWSAWKEMPRHGPNIQYVLTNELMAAIDFTLGLWVPWPDECVFKGIGREAQEWTPIPIPAVVITGNSPPLTTLGYPGLSGSVAGCDPSYLELPPESDIDAVDRIIRPLGAEAAIDLMRRLLQEMEVVEGGVGVTLPATIVNTGAGGKPVGPGEIVPRPGGSPGYVENMPGTSEFVCGVPSANSGGACNFRVAKFDDGTFGALKSTNFTWYIFRNLVATRVRAVNVNLDQLSVNYRVRFSGANSASGGLVTRSVSLREVDWATYWLQTQMACGATGMTVDGDGTPIPTPEFDWDHHLSGSTLHANMSNDVWYEGSLVLQRVSPADRFKNDPDRQNDYFSGSLHLLEAFTIFEVDVDWSTDLSEYEPFLLEPGSTLIIDDKTIEKWGNVGLTSLSIEQEMDVLPLDCIPS